MVAFVLVASVQLQQTAAETGLHRDGTRGVMFEVGGGAKVVKVREFEKQEQSRRGGQESCRIERERGFVT